ncbi:MAG: protease SohB [Gammaproteobacteria bacterium]|nr:protease SohB [Gammaproteobacteria bacterium]
MAEFFADYGLFLLKVLTFVVAIIVVVMVVGMAAARGRKAQAEGHIEIRKLNESMDELRESLKHTLMNPALLKQSLKEKKAAEKAKSKEEKKAAKEAAKQRGKGQTVVEEPRSKAVYVVNFDGDIRASAVSSLRKEVTAILTAANIEDEVVLKLESGGGMVTGYGLAASQLDRLRHKEIPLTICIDKVAASGGYMMACVADKILAAPFAVVGSIGVVAQLPNFHRLLKEHNIDVELLTAGKYKRTLTMFGENTDEGRDKFIEDIEQIHTQFKDYVQERRPDLNIEEVATGEIWSGEAAKAKKLIDEIKTSDEYLLEACERADVFEVKYKQKKPIMEKFGMAAQSTIDGVLFRWFDRLMRSRFSIG